MNFGCSGDFVCNVCSSSMLNWSNLSGLLIQRRARIYVLNFLVSFTVSLTVRPVVLELTPCRKSVREKLEFEFEFELNLADCLMSWYDEQKQPKLSLVLLMASTSIDSNYTSGARLQMVKSLKVIQRKCMITTPMPAMWQAQLPQIDRVTVIWTVVKC